MCVVQLHLVRASAGLCVTRTPQSMVEIYYLISHRDHRRSTDLCLPDSSPQWHQWRRECGSSRVGSRPAENPTSPWPIVPLPRSGGPVDGLDRHHTEKSLIGRAD